MMPGYRVRPQLLLSSLWLFLMLGSCISTEIEKDERTPAEVFEQINEEVLKNSKAYESLEEITKKIGHRLTGSENGKKAEEHVFGLLRSYGIENVDYHEFEVKAWQRHSVSFGIIEELPRKGVAEVHFREGKPFTGDGKMMPRGYFHIPSVALAHSPDTAALLERIIDVGNGLRQDFEDLEDSIKGKVVLLNIGIYPRDTTLKNLHRSEKTALAIQYGAVGAIFINTVEGDILLTGTASVTGDVIPVPAICISLESGEYVRKQLQEGKKLYANLLMKNSVNLIKARNVIATIPGTDLPGEEIIICGHLDSWDLSVGAIDNGIGSFSIIEMARVFQKLKLKPRRTVRFVLFMGEEQGLLGSKAYMRDRIKDGTADKVRYVINIDMGGNTMGFNASGRKEMEQFIRDVGASIAKTDTVFKNRYADRVGLHSDHQTFMLEGIPVMGIESELDPGVYKFYHSNKDDFSLVNKEHMNNCVRFTSMMLYALANADSIAARRLSSMETKEFFEKANLKEELILGKEWRWGEEKQ
jgi:carboxypeptidase Q